MRDQVAAPACLKALDLHLAIKLGLAKSEAAKPAATINIADG